MTLQITEGILIPMVGTALGSACVLFMRKEMKGRVKHALIGFASGVMIAAAVWSLLVPAMEESKAMGKFSFVPAVAGFAVGMLFLLLLDSITPHMHTDESAEGPKSNFKKTTMMVFAVALHNIPEGMAVGVVFAGWASGQASVSVTGAMILAIGIAIQNFPEGAIISMPLHSNGLSKGKSFLYGVLSGIVEPIASVLTILVSSMVVPILPYLQGFAAGAMFYVVVEELIPDMSEGKHSNVGPVMFMLGFCLMVALDVALG